MARFVDNYHHQVQGMYPVSFFAMCLFWTCKSIKVHCQILFHIFSKLVQSYRNRSDFSAWFFRIPSISIFWNKIWSDVQLKKAKNALRGQNPISHEWPCKGGWLFILIRSVTFLWAFNITYTPQTNRNG